MVRLGSENSRPNGGCQEHAQSLTVICDSEAGKGLTKWLLLNDFAKHRSKLTNRRAQYKLFEKKRA